MSKPIGSPVRKGKNRIALGVDLSFSGTGLVKVHGTVGTEYKLVKPPGPRKACLEERIDHVVMEVLGWAVQVDVVAIEGAAFGKHTASFIQGQLSGVVRHQLWMAEVPFVIIPPTQNKKGATGKGNATKDEMVAASRKYIPSNKDDNIADALFLGLYIRDHYDELVTEEE